MTVRRTPQQRISDLLRNALTDPNSVRKALGTEWIYPDKPRLTNLSKSKDNFPRLSVIEIDLGTDGDIGMGGTETEDTVILSITAWCYADSAHSIIVGDNDAKIYSGNNLAEAITHQVHIWLRDNWRDYPDIMDYEKTGSSPYLNDYDGTIKKHTITIKFKGVNLGD